MNQELLALIVFGILLAIALFGLVKSNAAAARLTGSRSGLADSTARLDEPSRVSGAIQT